MARRKSRKTRTRRSPKTFNVSGLAESALIANAVTTGMFGLGLRDFVMNTDGRAAGSSIVTGATQITARELFAGLTGGDANTTYSITSQGRKTMYGEGLAATIGNNVKENAGSMIFNLIAIPAGFRVFNKLTTKPRGTLNKALKMSGLPVKV